MQVITVQPITDRPIIDAIANNDFFLIGDASDGNQVKRVSVATLKAFILDGLPDPTPPTGSTRYLGINCGDRPDNYTDLTGAAWVKDDWYTGGTALLFDWSIEGVSDQTLYQSLRVGDFSYNIPLPNGSYILKLGFAEIGVSAEGDRVFNVTAQGQSILSNFDILAEVPKYNTLIKSFPVTVTDGFLSLGFVTVVDSSLLSFIEILSPI